MSYNYRYINKQVFSNSVSYTLLLEDVDQDGEDLVRIEKTFKLDDKQIDEEFLRFEAKKEIDRILEQALQQDVIEIPPDEAISSG